MSISQRCFTLIIIFVAIGLNVSAQQAGDTVWTPKTAKKWVKGGAWRNESTLKPHSSVNDVEFARQYHKNKQAWDKAFIFLSNKRLDTLAAGKYLIDGTNVYATITDVPSKEFDKSAWESHRNYIDLQYVISGKEKIGVSPVASATVTKPYDEAKDVANYNAGGKYYTASPSEFFLFFPADAHRPNIKAEGYETAKVKKLVIKIKFIN
jgi:biofilm protein TabA